MLIVSMLISLIDIVLIFLFASKLVNKPAYLDLKRVAIGVGYGLAMGTLAYFTFVRGNTNNVHQIVAMAIDLILIYKITQEKYVKNLLGYGIFIVVLTVIQLPTILILELLITEQQILFLIAQLLTLIVLMIIYWKVPIDKLYRFMCRQYWLQLVIAIVSFLLVGLMFYWSFEYSILSIGVVTTILIAMLIVIYQIGRKVVYLTYTVPSKMHDFRNRIHGKMLKAYQEGDHTRIAVYHEIYEENGFQMEADKLHLGKTTENIVSFIETKKEEHHFNAEIIHDINYYKDHLKIGIEVIIKCMGILLDNALESGTDKPIIVELDTGMGHIRLYVRNEFQLTDPEAIERIFTGDGYTTKKAHGRGYGMGNLHREVTKCGGKIVDSYGYNEVGKSYYLTIGVEF